MKNILNIEITRPFQVLVIFRGIPGSGKSTLAKTLITNGVIHSTDDVIESMCDYREFFAKMNESKDFSALHKAHDINFKNAVKSIKSGVLLIGIDNTHIKANEAKKIVVKALELGLDDKNIRFVDIGTNGLSAEELAERNTHGVPLEKIKSMIDSYKSVGPLTIDKILASKDIFKTSPILYSAVVLDTASRTLLLDRVGAYMIPTNWVTIAHHMTISLGPLKDKSDIGKEITLEVTHIGYTDMVIAVRVDGYVSKNDIPHITLAVNPEGGKPAMSKDITNYQTIKPFFIKGIVTEISRYKEKV